LSEKHDPHIVAAMTGPERPRGAGLSGGAGDVVLLSIPSKPEYVGLSRLAVAGVARVSDLPEEAVADLKLAVTEACTFALQHVQGQRDACLAVGFRVTPHSWVIDVTWPSGNPGGDAALADGGLGLAVMRALVDGVDLESSFDGRSLLRLTKQL